MSTVYLAYSSAVDETLALHAREEAVDLLVAYPALGAYLKARRRFNVRRWVLDSGAFSVARRGAVIPLDDYITACRNVDADEVFGLDVIGDPRATRENLLRMWKAGVLAIPTFHYGSDWTELGWCVEMARRMGVGKIALGGVAKRPDSVRIPWVLECFRRVWPVRIHGFGMASRKAIEAAPFHSVDASSWAFAPFAMGAWAGFTGRQVALKARGVRDCWVEVIEHQRRARWAASRWARELERIKGAA